MTAQRGLSGWFLDLDKTMAHELIRCTTSITLYVRRNSSEKPGFFHATVIGKCVPFVTNARKVKFIWTQSQVRWVGPANLDHTRFAVGHGHPGDPVSSVDSAQNPMRGFVNMPINCWKHVACHKMNCRNFYWRICLMLLRLCPRVGRWVKAHIPVLMWKLTTLRRYGRIYVAEVWHNQLWVTSPLNTRCLTHSSCQSQRYRILSDS